MRINQVKNNITPYAIELRNEMVSHLSPSLKLVSKFSKFAGDTPNIIVNAIGTGIVAPFFIKHNFLSKTDEDTRNYSALRQPILAVISTVFMVSVVLPIDKVINKMSELSKFANNKFNKYPHINPNVRGLKQVIGLVVSLATIPVSASIFNYFSPKIIKLISPNLAKAHGGEKNA